MRFRGNRSCNDLKYINKVYIFIIWGNIRKFKLRDVFLNIFLVNV